MAEGNHLYAGYIISCVLRLHLFFDLTPGSITADTAIRLGRYFRMEAKFWMNLQASYDLDKTMLKSRNEIYQKVHPKEDAA